MAEVLFNDKGIPLMASGKTFMMDTAGSPAVDPKTITQVTPEIDDKVSVGNLSVASWGTGNGFPSDAESIIGKTGVLNTGLRFIQRVIVGQGIFACKYTLISMNNIKVVDKDGKFDKDKSFERKRSILPEEATHFGDAADKRIWTKYSNLLTRRSNIFVDARFGK